MKMLLNPGQAAAVHDFDHDLLVTAGAGTGKTRVLTFKYLTLLKERRVEAPQIVAVTFTKKAADEMRARIREGIKSEIETCAPGERDFWLRQLEALETAAHISTIHGLCYSLLAEHPVEAGLDPGAEVMDEGEVYLLQSEAAEEALHLLLDGPHGREAAKVVLEQGVPFFTRDLVGIYHTLRESGQSLEEIWRISAENLKHGLAPVADVKATFCRSVEDFIVLGNSLPKITAKAKERLDELAAGWKPAKTVIMAAEVLEEELQAHLDWICSLLPRNTVRELKEPTNEIRACLETFRKTLVTKVAGEQLPLIREYLRIFAGEYRRRKEMAGRMDFGDQQILARDLLTNYPEIARSYQERFAYFLFDEVQDTNSLQWEILSKLIYANGVSHSKGRVFLVGDVKQSIYRFRGAEVEVITELASGFSSDSASNLLGGQGRTLILEENYRTLRPVADVINDLCKPIFSSEDYPFHPLVAVRSDEAADDPRVEMVIHEERRTEPAALATRIKEIVERGEITLKTRSGERRAGYGDVALLFRTTTNLRAYEEAFRRLRIPFLVNMGTGFYSRPEIQDQISLLRLVENPADDLALAEVLRSPFCALSDDELFWLAYPQGLGKGFYREDLPAEIDEESRERLCAFRALLRQWQGNIHLLTITDLLRLAMEETDYLAVSSALPDGKRRLANLEKFQHRAGDFVRKGYSGVREFVTFIEQLSTLSVREGEAPTGKEDDVVQMMTVHAAKGLEFPVVVLPELGQRFMVSQTSPVFFHKKLGFAHKVLVNGVQREETFLTERIKDRQRREEISELKRLFYVALTRAEDYLLFSGCFTKNQVAADFDQAGSWLEWIYQAIPDLACLTRGVDSWLNWGGHRLKITWGASYVQDELPLPRALTREEEETVEAAVSVDGTEELVQAEEEIAATALWQGWTRNSLLPQRIALSPLLTFMQCPRRFYWEHRLGTNGDYAIVGAEQIGVADVGKPAGIILGEAFHRLVAATDEARAFSRQEVEGYFSGLAAPEREKARGRLETMYANYLQSPFSPSPGVRILNEYPFLLHLEGVVIKGTIDRLLFYPDGRITVVDFKTNRQVPQGFLLHEYESQISVYAMAVQEIFGKTPSGAFIYFVRPNQIISTSLAPEDLSAVKSEILEIVDFIGSHDQPGAYLRAPEAQKQAGACETCPFIPWCEAAP
ncbi:MAG TPA: UvrD-helicase domain-containing protein [Firmicutes bacterium]|nr:UvrD-helicase domain-containing protein [Bacillota bacterium]